MSHVFPFVMARVRKIKEISICAVIDGRTVEDSIISGPVFTVLMVSDETRKSEFPHSL